MQGRIRAAGASGVLAAGLVAAGMQPISAVAAASGCSPRIFKLPLPAGYIGGSVIDMRGDVLVGRVSTTSGSVAAQWRRTSGGFRVRTFASPPGAVSADADQINAASDIVAIASVPDGTLGYVISHGRRYLMRNFVGEKAGTYTRQINDSGVVAGGAVEASGTMFGALWRSWTSRPQKLLPPRGDVDSIALGINNRNDAVGNSTAPNGADFHGELWPRGSTRPVVLPGFGNTRAFPLRINDRRRIVGEAGHSDGTGTAAVWDGVSAPRDLGMFRGDNESYLLGISQGGRAVGESIRQIDANTLRYHVLYWPGHGPAQTLLPLTRHYGDSSAAHAVDDRGNVAGVSDDGSGILQPTLWTCADRQAFVPPRNKTSREAGSVPQVSHRHVGPLPARMRGPLGSLAQHSGPGTLRAALDTAMPLANLVVDERLDR